jgi:hypothetical protein
MLDLSNETENFGNNTLTSNYYKSVSYVSYVSYPIMRPFSLICLIYPLRGYET